MAEQQRHDTNVDLLILCLGSRGDVQPFLNLAVHASRTRGWRVVVACADDYRALVVEAAAKAAAAGNRGAVSHAPLGGSFTEAMRLTPAGRALREARSIKAALAAAEAFFTPLACVWAREARALCSRHRPRLLLHSTFTLFAAFAAPFYAARDCAEGEGRRRAEEGGVGGERSDAPPYVPRVAVAHTVPSHATRFFLPPTTGQGFVAPAWLPGRGLLHRLAWAAGFAGAHRAVYVPLTRAAGRELMTAAAAGGGSDGGGGGNDDDEDENKNKKNQAAAAAAPPLLPTWRDAERAAPTPTFYVWSPALVPRPDDWPATAAVVGAQLTAAQDEGGEGGGDCSSSLLPADLRELLSSARREGRPVVLATLGSMLGAVLEGDEARRALEALVRGAGEAAAAAAAGGSKSNKPPVVVVHATTGKRDGEDEGGVRGGGGGEGPAFDLPALARLAAEMNASAAAALSSAAPSSSTPPLPAVHLLTQPVPHALLLPRCDLVLHHAGAGTTHAALAAGVPSLPLPCAHASDQPWWADVLRRSGAAPPRAAAPLPPLAADLTPGAFAAALRGALAGFGEGGGGGQEEGGGGVGSGDNERPPASSSSSSSARHAEPYLSLKRSAERVGAAVRAERGTERLAAELERVLAGPPAVPPPAPWGPF